MNARQTPARQNSGDNGGRGARSTRSAHGSRAAAGDLQLGIRALGRVPGSTEAVERDAAVGEAIGVEFMRLPQGSTVHLDLALTCVDEGVLVTGPVTGTAEVECARCLGHFTTETSVELTELYAYPGTAAADGVDTDEVRLVDGDRIDLEPALVDAFGLDFPLAPTCEYFDHVRCVRGDVPEPDGESGAPSGRIDPRWAGLRDLDLGSR